MGIADFFSKQEWIYSKTYAEKAPHEYIVRENINGTDDEFIEAVNYIRANGFVASFWRHPNTYLYLDGKFYWTMGAPVEETVVINRCDPSNYDLVFIRKKE